MNRRVALVTIEYPTALVRLSPELVAQLSAGYRCTRWEFGEPDDKGFFSPTIYFARPDVADEAER